MTAPVTWLLLSVVLSIMIPFVVHKIVIKPSTLFYCNFVIVCVLMWCFSDDIEDPERIEYIFVIRGCIGINDEVSIDKN